MDVSLQVKWNQFSSNNSFHTSCIHKGLHAGKWPGLMTCKLDSVSTLEYNCADHTGRPLEPQVHWDATGTTLPDASTQWCSIGDPVLICIIVPFHKSQCAMRCWDPMSKIQNTSSQRSLATWLTVAANEQNDDWPASVSIVSVQPVIGWLRDEVARHWSHIVHRPRPHGNLPLPCIVRNGLWYCVKYSSLKSFYVLQSHPASIPNHEMKFCGSVVWVRWQQIKRYIWYFAGLSQVFIF